MANSSANFLSIANFLLDIPTLDLEIGVGQILDVDNLEAIETSQVLATRLDESVDISPTVVFNPIINRYTYSSSFSPLVDETDLTYIYIGYRDGTGLLTVLATHSIEVPSLLTTNTMNFEISIRFSI